MSTLPETGQIIQNALNLIDSHHYADAKLAILPSKPTVISNIINLYGGESDFFIKHLNPYLKSTVRTTCNLNSCPKPFQSFDSSVIILGRPSLHNAQAQEDNILVKAVDDWMSAGISQCKRKFENKPPDSVPFTEEVSLDEDGKESSFSWFCSGIRRHSQCKLVNPKNFVAFHVDTLSRTYNLTLAKIPSSIKLMDREYKFHSATLWNGTHYICTFYFNEKWYLYDGLKEYNLRNSGLQISDTRFNEPQGYSLSYLIYCA